MGNPPIASAPAGRWRPGEAVALGVFGTALLMLAAILFASLSPLDGPQGPEEASVLASVQSMVHRGPAELPDLVANWIGDRGNASAFPPTRVGFLGVAASWAALFGASVRSLRYLSLAGYLAHAAVLFFFARRHFGQFRGTSVAILAACSALWMGTSRLALADAFQCLCISTTVWLFLDLLLDPGSFRKRILFGTVFAIAILANELAALLTVPFAGFVLWEGRRGRSTLRIGTLGVLLGLSGTAAILVFVATAGSFERSLAAARILLGSAGAGEDALRSASGPWFRCVVDELLLSPWTTLLGLGSLAVVVLRTRPGQGERSVEFFSMLLASILIASALYPTNIRNLAIVELPVRVLAVCLIADLAAKARPARAAPILAACILGLGCLEVMNFEQIWVRARAYDAATQFLAYALRIVPSPR